MFKFIKEFYNRRKRGDWADYEANPKENNEFIRSNSWKANTEKAKDNLNSFSKEDYWCSVCRGESATIWPYAIKLAIAEDEQTSVLMSDKFINLMLTQCKTCGKIDLFSPEILLNLENKNKMRNKDD